MVLILTGWISVKTHIFHDSSTSHLYTTAYKNTCQHRHLQLMKTTVLAKSSSFPCLFEPVLPSWRSWSLSQLDVTFFFLYLIHFKRLIIINKYINLPGNHFFLLQWCCPNIICCCCYCDEIISVCTKIFLHER